MTRKCPTPLPFEKVVSQVIFKFLRSFLNQLSHTQLLHRSGSTKSFFLKNQRHFTVENGMSSFHVRKDSCPCGSTMMMDDLQNGRGAILAQKRSRSQAITELNDQTDFNGYEALQKQQKLIKLQHLLYNISDRSHQNESKQSTRLQSHHYQPPKYFTRFGNTPHTPYQNPVAGHLLFILKINIINRMIAQFQINYSINRSLLFPSHKFRN